VSKLHRFLVTLGKLVTWIWKIVECHITSDNRFLENENEHNKNKRSSSNIPTGYHYHSVAHPVQACFSCFQLQGYANWYPTVSTLPLSLLVLYCPSRVLRSTFSAKFITSFSLLTIILLLVLALQLNCPNYLEHPCGLRLFIWYIQFIPVACKNAYFPNSFQHPLANSSAADSVDSCD